MFAAFHFGEIGETTEHHNDNGSPPNQIHKVQNVYNNNNWKLNTEVKLKTKAPNSQEPKTLDVDASTSQQRQQYVIFNHQKEKTLKNLAANFASAT